MRVGLKLRSAGQPPVVSLNLLPASTEEAPAWIGGEIEAPAFDLLPAVRPRPVSLVSSLAAHGVWLGFLLVIAPALIPDSLTQYTARPIRRDELTLYLPPPLHVPNEPAPEPEPSRPKRMEKPTLAAPAAPPDRPKFQLPPLTPKKNTELTLIQPLSNVEIEQPVNLRMPQVIQLSPLVKIAQPVKRFVMPANTVRNAQVPQIEAAPKLDVPNKMPDVRDLKMAGEVVMDRPPALPVPRATTMPVRTFVPPRAVPPTTSAGLDVFQGDDVNIVALSPNPTTALDSVRLPIGNQVASIHDVKRPDTALLGTGTAADPGQSNSVPDGVNRGAGATGQASAGQAATTSAAGGATSAAGSSRGSSTGNGQGSNSSSGSRLAGGLTVTGGPGGGNGSGTRVQLSSSSVPIRIEHPENRTFDVTVVQSAATRDASGAGLLSGSPIYTVYVPVLPTRNWVMQYCVPKESAIQARKGIAIQLGNPAPVKAPFPRITVVPPDLGEDRITLHGFITEGGAFRDLRVVNGESIAERLMVMPLLKQWTFRPATRDGVPIEVEVVVVIPRGRA